MGDNSEVKCLFERAMRDIKSYLKEIGCMDVDWFHLIQGGYNVSEPTAYNR